MTTDPAQLDHDAIDRMLTGALTAIGRVEEWVHEKYTLIGPPATGYTLPVGAAHLRGTLPLMRAMMYEIERAPDSPHAANLAAAIIRTANYICEKP